MTAAADRSTLTTTATPRVLTGWQCLRRRDLAAHAEVYGPLPDLSPARLADALERSGLRGRGGGGFPAARKLSHAASHRVAPIVVVNAMEGEPASQKDAVLLTCAPHLVLDGAMVVARAIGAREVVACVAAEEHDGASALARAIAERRRTPYAQVPVRLERPPGCYVAGEESALVDYLNGGAGLPSFRPDKSVAIRCKGAPAVVHNAETLAHVALVARLGEAAPATALVTVTGAVDRPGVFEVDLGSPLGDIVRGAGGSERPEGVLLGGFGGCWVGPDALDVPYDAASLARIGATPGAGVVAVLAPGACGLAETQRLVAYLASQSAGQCGPCVFGLPAIAGDLAHLADGRPDGTLLARLDRRCAEVDRRGACAHPDGAIRLVRSALATFQHDLQLHAGGRACPGRDRPSIFGLHVGGRHR